MEKYSFAKQYLSRKGIEIYAGDKRILAYNGSPSYLIRPQNTRIEVEELIDPDVEMEIIETYPDLKRIGFCLIKKNTNFGPKIILEEYQLGKVSFPLMGEYKIEFDKLKKRGRLLGRDAGYYGIGDWVYLGKKSISPVLYDAKTIFENPYEVLEEAKNIWAPEERGRLTINIPEMALIITEDLLLVCIPDTADEGTIGIVGQKGQGKSRILHRIVDITFWKWGKLGALINDSLRECGTWCLPNSTKSEIEILRRINEYPLPLPTIYLTPHTEDIENGEDTVMHSDEVGFPISMPYRLIIDKFYDYFDLGGSTTFFSKNKESLMVCENMDEVREVLETISNKNVIDKIDRYLSDIFKQKILDVNTGVPSEWSVKEGSYEMKFNPLTASVMAGLLPILVTDNILTKPYYPQYFKYFVNDIFTRQTKDNFFKKNKIKVWFFIDEVLDVSSIEEKTVASETLKKLVTQGRPTRIGTVLATQNYNSIEGRVRKNIKYMFTFANPGEASDIGKTYSLDRESIEQIKILPKFTCLAVTTEEFIVYDLKTGQRYKSRGPFVGKSLPPLSQHKTPSMIAG